MTNKKRVVPSAANAETVCGFYVKAELRDGRWVVIASSCQHTCYLAQSHVQTYRKRHPFTVG